MNTSYLILIFLNLLFAFLFLLYIMRFDSFSIQLSLNHLLSPIRFWYSFIFMLLLYLLETNLLICHIFSFSILFYFINYEYDLVSHIINCIIVIFFSLGILFFFFFLLYYKLTCMCLMFIFHASTCWHVSWYFYILIWPKSFTNLISFTTSFYLRNMNCYMFFLF